MLSRIVVPKYRCHEKCSTQEYASTLSGSLCCYLYDTKALSLRSKPQRATGMNNDRNAMLSQKSHSYVLIYIYPPDRWLSPGCLLTDHHRHHQPGRKPLS